MIDMLPDELQTEIAAVADRMAASIAGMSAVNVASTKWRELADVGVFGVGLAETVGGAGGGARAEVLVCERFGVHLAPVGIVAAIVAAHALTNADNPAAADVLAGTRRVALAVRAEGAVIAIDADPGDDGLIVLIDGEVVSIHHANGSIQRDSTDAGTVLSTVDIEDADTADPSGAAAARARLLLAAMAVGVSICARDRAVDYAKNRRQFSKPIGTFQAIKHRCVDMATRTEAALALVRLTAMRLDDGDLDAAAVAAANGLAMEAARRNAAAAIQVHGGIGFTAEAGIDRLLHRAWLLDNLSGTAAAQFESVLQRSLQHNHQRSYQGATP
ncbi:MAG TPA: acyl-CoA dehydrogenase family protein [Ilumatobacteraceae bacterium]|nr:acyl-CoA dehydrogenase family protein [Ilumatobacteraceae bacterium]